MCRYFLLFALLIHLSHHVRAQDNLRKPNMYDTAMLLELDMEKRFNILGQIAPKRRVPTESHPFPSYNMPDNAYMTGLNLAAQTYRWQVDQSDDTKRNAQNAAQALHTLIEITGIPGLFARSYYPWGLPFHDDGEWYRSADGKYRWRGDVSSDQVDGYMYGCSVYAEYLATEKEIQRMAKDCAAICTHIEENGMRIVGIDGEPTMWGNYTLEYVTNTEPMNALLWLQHLKVTAQLTNDQKWEEKYRYYAVEKGYLEIATKAYSGEPGLDGEINHSDIVLHFIAYEPLFRLEKDEELLTQYRKSLMKSWEYLQKINQPYFTYLYAKITNQRDLPEIVKSTENLKTFTVDIHWNKDTREHYSKEYSLNLEPVMPITKPTKEEPIQYAWWDKTWSLLVHDPYQAPASTIPRPDSGVEYTGLHWTISYWLGRAEGFISDSE